MKSIKNIVFLIALTFVCWNISAQEIDCKDQLSLYYEFYKNKNYDEAFEPWKKCFENCPDVSKNLYIHGVRMIDYYIKKNKENHLEKRKYTNLLLDLYDQRLRYFPKDKAYFMTEKATYMYLHKLAPKNRVFLVYNDNFVVDDTTRISSKSHYYYFKLVKELFKEELIPQDSVFSIYEKLVESAENNINLESETAGNLQLKFDSVGSLSLKDENMLKRANAERKLFDQVKSFLDGSMGKKFITCDKLTPTYEADFAENSKDKKWLKSSANILYRKGCDTTDIYKKIVEAYYYVSPSAVSTRSFALKKFKEKNYEEAIAKFEESAKLEKDKFKQAFDYYMIGLVKERQGKKSSARSYAYKAAKQRPGWGKPYVLIARLYGNSADQCGNDEFEKRSTYWAAADMALKAQRVDPSKENTSIAGKYFNSYIKSAPPKETWFQKGYTKGNSIRIGCWINQTTKVR